MTEKIDQLDLFNVENDNKERAKEEKKHHTSVTSCP